MIKAKPRNLIPIILALVLSFGAYLFLTTPDVSAGHPEGNHYETGFPMGIALKAFMGKHVNITLMSGDKIEGRVTEVGSEIVQLVFQQPHLSKSTGKSYHEILIRIDTISAVAVKGRT